MRYLAYIKPPAEFCESVEEMYKSPYNRPLIKPASGFHCTLWGFNANYKDEDKIIKTLEDVVNIPFFAKTWGAGEFDQGTLVLLLQRSKILNKLHQEIVKKTREYDKDTKKFDEMLKKYGGKRYTPHITIAKGYNFQNSFVDISKVSRLRFVVNSFYLAKKKDDKWVEVKEF